MSGLKAIFCFKLNMFLKKKVLRHVERGDTLSIYTMATVDYTCLLKTKITSLYKWLIRGILPSLNPYRI